MSALDALFAPPVIPDVTDDAYHLVRRVLDDHPATRDMEPMALMSLAQQVADAATEDLRAEVDQLQSELGDATEAAKGSDTARKRAVRDLKAAQKANAAARKAGAQ